MAAVPAPKAVTPWDAIPGMVVVLRPDGTALEGNAAFRAFARPDADVAGRGWEQVLPEASKLALKAALAERVDFRLQLEVVPGAGDAGAFEWAGRWCPEQQHYVCLLHDMTAASRAQAAAQSQAVLFRLLADNVPVLIAYYRVSDLKCQFANKAYARSFGRDEESIVGLTFAEVIGEEAARRIDPEVQKITAERVPVAYERTMKTPDGGTRWIEVHLLPHLDADGSSLGTFVLISDITKHRQVEQALRESEERLAKFMQATAEGIVFHKDGVIIDANPPLCDLLGYTLDELLGHRTTDFIAPDHLAKVNAVIASGQETTYESVAVDKRGQRIPVEFIVRTMVRNGESLRMTIVRDIRDRVAAQARIHHMAHHDALTGLPNRMSFMERLEQSMLAARAQRSRLALLFVDLDHFKRVNDSLGHIVGDTLLRTVAVRIIGALRGTDVVARFGGDEFMVLVAGLPSDAAQRDDVGQVAQQAPLRDRGAGARRGPADLGDALDRHRPLPRRRRVRRRADQARRLGDVPGQGARPREPPVLRSGDGRRRPMPRW